uniref:Ig-like domain-containing protein n=1 Tax=Erpetoichthys calabaricus TaxID=27687 RepID=A0A8C4RYS7_ERPCA
MVPLCLIYRLVPFSSVLGVTSHAEVTEVNGVEGGSVKIDCRYEKGFENNEKYLANVRWTLNAALIKTTKPKTLVMEGRYSVYDNTSVRVLTITIKELRMSDAGTYWCVVERNLMADDYTEVRLTVHPVNDMAFLPVCSLISRGVELRAWMATVAAGFHSHPFPISDQFSLLINFFSFHFNSHFFKDSVL